MDGLDECQGHDDQCRILTQVSHIVNNYHLPLCFLIVSRPESHLLEAFKDLVLANITERFLLYGDLHAHDNVSIYLRNEFSRIYDSQRHRDIMEFVPRPWPPNDVIQQIVHKLGGYFIYASTVIRFNNEEYFSPANHLDQVLNSSNPSLPSSDSSPFAKLDKLYLQILSSSPKSKLPLLNRILGYIVVPSFVRFIHRIAIDMDVIEAFLHLPQGQVKLMLRGLRSLVSFGESFGDVGLHLHHAFFRDFLCDKARSRDYHVDPEEWMYTVFSDAFSLGCNMLGFSGNNSASWRDQGLLATAPSSLWQSGEKVDISTSRMPRMVPVQHDLIPVSVHLGMLLSQLKPGSTH